MRKCPPGVFCIENMTLVLILIIVLITIALGYTIISKVVSNSKTYSNKYTVNISDTDNNHSNENQTRMGLYPRPGYTFSNIENDVLLNPYQAPLRDNRIFPNLGNNFLNKIPINVATQSYDTNYRQIGILTRIGGDKETILPLMGRPLITNRDKWNFYAMSESNNLLKLPISIQNGMSTTKCNTQSYTKCMEQNGCNDLYTGDTVKVDGYNDMFKVTTYENNMPQYIPYL